MKKLATHENFEDFLKESADDLQMRPTATVWRRIESRLNRRRRWVFFSSAFFLLTASLFGYLIIDNSKAPSDPFAGIHTVTKKAAVPESNTTGTELAGLSPAHTASPKSTVQHRPVLSSGTKLFKKPIPVPEALASVAAADVFTPTVVDEHQPAAGSTSKSVVPLKKGTVTDPLTIESVVNAYQPKLRKHKSEFQFFFTPTISYRRLTENKSYLRAVPQNLATVSIAALYDVNSMVTHKPDLGLELGFAYKVPVTKYIKLRTGLQFNVNRYDIKAFTYVPERATITLNNRARGVDSVNTISNHRNFNGSSIDWLQNFYFQVSTPVGVEVALSNAKKKTRFGIATTIQPTYVLGDRAYLISTDYKNYSQVPWLMRRWNVNTSLETFVSYSTGNLRWQVGPQVRYQLLSSFVEKYPVKENLFDFGMKVGISLDKK